MNNKRLIFVLLTMLAVLSLSGCQLARENAQEEADHDRLIGVFITTEYLDLFDYDEYLKDNPDIFFTGEAKTGGSKDYFQGRLYATRTESTLHNEETGEEISVQDYVFNDVAGISFFSAIFSGSNGSEPYIASTSDEAISDGFTKFHYGDDEEKVSLEGTIYVSPAHLAETMYINPVYQSADHSVYAISGDGLMLSGSIADGFLYSQTLDETTTVTENDEVTTASISVKISISSMLTPEKIVILQMNKDSDIVVSDEFTPEDVPETLIAHPATEYIVIETYKTDLEGTPVVTRELFSQSDETISSFYCRADGLCVKKGVQVVWE